MPKGLDQYGEKTTNPYDATKSPAYYSDEPRKIGYNGFVRKGKYLSDKKAYTAPTTFIDPEQSTQTTLAHEATHVAQLYGEPDYIWVNDQDDIDRREAGFGGGEVGKRRLDWWINKHKSVLDENVSNLDSQHSVEYSRDPIEATANTMGFSDARFMLPKGPVFPEVERRAENSRKALYDYYDTVKQVDPKKADLLQAQGPESVRRGYANHPQPVRLPRINVEEKGIFDYFKKR